MSREPIPVCLPSCPFPFPLPTYIRSHPSIRPIHAHTDYGGGRYLRGGYRRITTMDVDASIPGPPPPMPWQVGCSDQDTVDTLVCFCLPCCFSQLQVVCLSFYLTARWFPKPAELLLHTTTPGGFGYRRWALAWSLDGTAGVDRTPVFFFSPILSGIHG
jgi:hypothetical protein